ncbi:MAG: RimK family protein [Bdellovibrionales bacterium]|nr:RimK family protein [Bdellovibrionales bacterium]
MDKIIVVNDPRKWKLKNSVIEVISSQDYLKGERFSMHNSYRVFNLCDEYKYQSSGYYVSLLALARGHTAIPDVRTILNLYQPTSRRIINEELEDVIQSRLSHLKKDTFELSIYFGKNLSKKYEVLAQELSKYFRAPLLRATFTKEKKHWTLNKIKPIPASAIPEAHIEYVSMFANEYFVKKKHSSRKGVKVVYDLAMLVNDADIAPPSNKKAIEKFVKIGKQVGFNVDIIKPTEISKLSAYDALLIRENTHVAHHTYKFACRAEADGLAVIDTPDAIMRCSNKVFLTELLSKNNIPTPKTEILHSKNLAEVLSKIGIPCVLKAPDSTFSLGVHKAENKEEFYEIAQNMLKKSELILAQEFTPSDFDWRIGVLNNKAIFACKYFMARNHWQIYNWSSKSKKEQEGEHETLRVGDAPKALIKIAEKAASLIGDGLFGVDLKMNKNQAVVIEVNENPNIDAGVEDQVLGDDLYKMILKYLRNKIEEKHHIISMKYPLVAS